MPDMLVNLYQLPDSTQIMKEMEENGIRIVRALSPNQYKVMDFIEKEFGIGWASETAAAFSRSPISCYIAVKDHEIVGFGCYDATCLGYFGPTGVAKSERGQGIGAALLLKCLEAMREDGYGYAIIGSAGPGEFYSKCCGARVIENDQPNTYSRMV